MKVDDTKTKMSSLELIKSKEKFPEHSAAVASCVQTDDMLIEIF